MKNSKIYNIIYILYIYLFIDFKMLVIFSVYKKSTSVMLYYSKKNYGLLTNYKHFQLHTLKIDFFRSF